MPRCPKREPTRATPPSTQGMVAETRPYELLRTANQLLAIATQQIQF